MPRSRPLTARFRVSEQELDQLRAAASADRRTLSDWLRIITIDAAENRTADERLARHLEWERYRGGEK